MNNLGGHDLPAIIEAFDAIDHDRPVCFIAYTIKGYGLPLAGHKDNHAGLMTRGADGSLSRRHEYPPGHEWDRFEGLRHPEADIEAFLDRVPFAQAETRAIWRPGALRCPMRLPLTLTAGNVDAAGFWRAAERDRAGAKRRSPPHRHHVARRHGVDQSRRLGQPPRPVRARSACRHLQERAYPFDLHIWEFAPKGQHIELGIAEMNLFIAACRRSACRTPSIGERLLPIGTLYDPFIARGLDALNYACYQDARFVLVATPSGITLVAGGRRASIDRRRP